MSGLARCWGLVAVVAWCGAALAQMSLVVDGRSVGEVRTDVVSGHSYAPVDSLASGLAAGLAAPAGTTRVVLTLGGHVVEIDVVDDASGANRSGAVRLDGRPVGDLAAVQGDDAIWAPVTPVARAFGGQVSFMPEANSVVVVSSRAQLTDVDIEGDRRRETLTLALDAPAAWTRFENAALGLTELHLDRALLVRARTLEGDLFRRVDLIPEGDGVRVRIDAPGATVDVVAVADGAGSRVLVRAVAGADAASEDGDEEGDARVVLDPAGGGDGERLLALAEEVARLLRREGIEAELTRSSSSATGLGERAEAGASADLFATLDTAELPAGEVRIWVLGDPEDEGIMNEAVRRNAATALAAGVEDEVRRRILVGLVPDLEIGRRYGRSLATTLFQLGGYRAGGVGEAPLAVLTGAAGRGVLLEFAAADVADDRLAEVLAAGIRSALGGDR